MPHKLGSSKASSSIVG